MRKKITCIICPAGCEITVDTSDGTITGNGCARGAKYAEEECVSPKRTLTTTVMCDNGKLLPVKTDTPVLKENIFKCMEIINKTIAKTPVKAGDIIIKNVFGSNIKATKNIK